MIPSLISLLILSIVTYELWNVHINKKKSIIIPFIKNNSRRVYNRYIKKYNIIMSDIDDTKIRDLSHIELAFFIQKITDITRRETNGIVERIDTYKTQNGRHIIIFLHNNISMKEVIIILDYLNTDIQYKTIFQEKGYFTLFQVRRGKQNMSDLKKYHNNNGFMEVK